MMLVAKLKKAFPCSQHQASHTPSSTLLGKHVDPMQLNRQQIEVSGGGNGYRDNCE